MVNRKVKKEKFNKKLIPLLMIMIIPFIMYYQYIKYDTVITNPNYVTSEYYYDLFSFYKTIAIYIIALLSIIFYFLYTKRNDMVLKIERKKYYIPVIIYAVFIIISTIFAIYPKVAVFGLYERYEGALALLSYLIFMVYAIETIKEEIDFRTILNAFLTMVFVLSTIGVLQKYVIDIFSISFFQRLVGIPKGALIKSNFHNWAYATLYNPNNLGQFAAMCSPVVLGIIFTLKTIKGRIFGVITFILSILAGIASSSSNFLAGIIVAFFMLFILYASHLIPGNKKLRLAFLISIILIVIGLISASGLIWNRLKETEFIKKELVSMQPETNDIYFKSITWTEDTITFDTTKGMFYLKYMERGISFYDSAMNYIEFEQNNNLISFVNDPYKEQWSVKVTSENTMDIIAKRAYSYARIEIIFDAERFLGIRGTGGKILRDIIDNQMPEKLQGLETIASRRGYLWFVTASRLDEVIFIGAGPDNFLYWFEQNDVVGKINFLHETSVLADKPHNWFLQIASQTGVVSLLSFLAMIGIYIVSSFKIIGLKRKNGFYEFISSGIMCGIAGCLVSSLFVDSTVGTTPIFYVLLGIGIVSNEKLRQIRIRERNLNKLQ